VQVTGESIFPGVDPGLETVLDVVGLERQSTDLV